MAIEWYILHTYSGQEYKVKKNIDKQVEELNLQDVIKQVKIPVKKVVDIKKGKKTIKDKKLFPGYILVEMEMSDDTWYILQNTPGVTNFVSTGEIVPLSKEEVKNIFYQMGEGEGSEKTPLPETKFIVGETVKIIDGPFINFPGSVEEVYPEKQRLKVKVEIFGRSTPVELDYSQIEKL